jgi:hypothetical protein
VKEHLRENDNPILASFKSLIKAQSRNGQMPKDYLVNMLPIQII